MNKPIRLCASPDELRARWVDAGQRADIIHQLADCGIVGDATCTLAELAAQTVQLDTNTFDLLWHPNAPVCPEETSSPGKQGQRGEPSKKSQTRPRNKRNLREYAYVLLG